jgi:hypothetical protein
MKLFGIFDKNKNYELLRYSTNEQTEHEYQKFNPIDKTYFNVHEICYSDIEYDQTFIGKNYNPESKSFI